MKYKKGLLYLGIICIIGAGIVFGSIYWNKAKSGKEKDITFAESELPITSENLVQDSFYMSGSSFNDALTFRLNFENVGYEVICWDEYATFRIKRKEDTEPPVYVHKLLYYHYPEVRQEVRAEWIPYDLSPQLAEDYEEIGKNDQISLNMNHYVYVILTQEGHIVGLILLKFPVDNMVYQEIELIASIQFEKQNGEYQKVTRDYIEKRVKEMIEADTK